MVTAMGAAAAETSEAVTAFEDWENMYPRGLLRKPGNS